MACVPLKFQKSRWLYVINEIYFTVLVVFITARLAFREFTLKYSDNTERNPDKTFNIRYIHSHG